MLSKRNPRRRQRMNLNWRRKLKKNTLMKKETNKDLTSFADHLDNEYGKRGTKKRETYEREFEAFKIGVLIQEMRERQNMTQEQLADKVGTTKSYISRIENNASDIRLSTLMRIIQDGLGGHLKLSLTA